jgi:hypothetical protein
MRPDLIPVGGVHLWKCPQKARDHALAPTLSEAVAIMGCLKCHGQPKKVPEKARPFDDDEEGGIEW